MKPEYDLANMKSRPNPYAKKLNKICDAFPHFVQVGVKEQLIINRHLPDCCAY
ncbi:MAG: antitoxin [Moorea sp. SIOASIH]|nr:antitoxin [Moorena sp. SIOASIH]